MRRFKLRVFENRCEHCGERFETLHLAAHEYGVQLFGAESGRLVYVDADRDPVWQEIEALIHAEAPELVGTRKELGVFDAVLMASVDGPEGGSTRRETCPCCGSEGRAFWGPVDPPRFEELELEAATHESWTARTEDQKRDLVTQALKQVPI